MTEFVVRGTASHTYDAERATVPLSAAFVESKSALAHERAVQLQSQIVTAVRALEQRGAVKKWSSDRIFTSSFRPTDSSGRLRAAQYRTSIAISVEFVDFVALSPFLDEWGARAGVDIGGPYWDVLEENRDEYEASVRAQAVRNAVAKAQAYADAVDAGRVRPLLLADPGMLSSGAGSPDGFPHVLAAPAMGRGAPALEIKAATIEIGVSVDARFSAGS